MATSISVKQKKRGRPATGKTPIAGVRLPDDLAAGVDAFAAEEADNPSRSEAIRRILRDWLVGHGYLKGSAQHGTRPQDLDASNDD